MGSDTFNNSWAKFLEAVEMEKRMVVQKLLPYQKILIEQYHMTEKESRDFLYGVEHISYGIDEFSSAFGYYLKEFGGINQLQEFVYHQSYIWTGTDHVERKNTIFTIRPYTIFGERMKCIEKIFHITREKCIATIIQNLSWLYHTQEYFTSRIIALAKTFNVSFEKMSSSILQYPSILNKQVLSNTEVLSKRILAIARYYSISEQKVKEFLIKFPYMINKHVGFYMASNIGKEIFDNHWLFELIMPGQDGYVYGGYRTFKNLIMVMVKIQENFGKIIKLYKRDYKDNRDYGNNIFHAVQTNNGKDIFIISIGSNAVTRYQRDYIVSEKQYRVDKKINEFLTFHTEYVCKIKDMETVNIDNILNFMSCLSAEAEKHKIIFNDLNNHGLVSNDIVTFDFPKIPPINYDKINLNLEFYKISPNKDSFDITSLMEEMPIAPIDSVNNIFDGLDKIKLFEEPLNYDDLFRDEEDNDDIKDLVNIEDLFDYLNYEIDTSHDD